MKNNIISILLIFTAASTLSAQLHCPIQTVPTTSLQLTITDLNSIGCPDLRVLSVGVNLWEIGPYIPNFSRSSVTVSGAGASWVNGVYHYTGVFEGKPYYNLEGEGTRENRQSIYWYGGAWRINDFTATPMYASTSDTVYPWLAFWEIGVGDGGLPVPLVTKYPLLEPSPQRKKGQ